jgi:hypothetical protein
MCKRRSHDKKGTPSPLVRTVGVLGVAASSKWGIGGDARLGCCTERDRSVAIAAAAKSEAVACSNQSAYRTFSDCRSPNRWVCRFRP